MPEQVIQMKLAKHARNKHGWPVSLILRDRLQIYAGFILNHFNTEEEQKLYIEEFQKFVTIELEDYTD